VDAAIKIQSWRRGELARRSVERRRSTSSRLRATIGPALFASFAPTSGRLESATLRRFAEMVGYDATDDEWKLCFETLCSERDWPPSKGPNEAEFVDWLGAFPDEEIVHVADALLRTRDKGLGEWTGASQEARFRKVWEKSGETADDVENLKNQLYDLRRCLADRGVLSCQGNQQPQEAGRPSPKTTNPATPRRPSRRSQSKPNRADAANKMDRPPGSPRTPRKIIKSSLGRRGPKWNPITKDCWPKQPEKPKLVMSVARAPSNSAFSPEDEYISDDVTQMPIQLDLTQLPAVIRPGWVTRTIRPGTSGEEDEFFMVTLNSGPGGNIGACLRSTDDGQLQVLSLEADGLLAAWNITHPDKAVCAGDIIVNINGGGGSAEVLLDRLKTGHRLNIRMQRANYPDRVVVVQVKKSPSAGLGLIIDHSCLEGLLITGVTADGLVAGWNLANKEEAIGPGDIIKQVNDTQGTNIELVTTIAAAKQDLRLTIERSFLNGEGLMAMAAQGPKARPRATRTNDGIDTSDKFGRGTYSVAVSVADRNAQELGLRLVGNYLQAPRPRPPASRGDALLGVTISALRVGGRLAAWNGSRAGRSIASGDRVLAVNGEVGRSEVLKGLCKGSRQLELTLTSSTTVQAEYEVHVDWSMSSHLGISVDMSEAARLIIVEIAAEGLIQVWNSQPELQHQVQPGDSISSVNGIRGTPFELLAALRSPGQRLVLHMKRVEWDRFKVWKHLLRACQQRFRRKGSSPTATSPTANSNLEHRRSINPNAPLVASAATSVASTPRAGKEDLADDEEQKQTLNFVVNIDRSNRARMGLNIDCTRDVPIVTGIVSGGLFEGWNLAGAGTSVLPGDLVTSVNGVTFKHHARMLQELRQAPKLRLTFQRMPVVSAFYTVVLDKEKNPSQSLGLEIDNSEEDRLLVASVLTGGQISAWNAENEGEEVTPGDEIIEVNGVKNDILKMMAHLKFTKSLVIGMRRSYKHRVARLLHTIFEKYEPTAHPLQEVRSLRRGTTSVPNVTAEEEGSAFGLAPYMPAEAFARPSLMSLHSVKVTSRLLELVHEEPLDRQGVVHLLAKGAETNAANDEGVRALHIAAIRGDPDLCTLLLSAHADPNARDEAGQTPLFFAKNVATCEVLRGAGASLSTRNNRGQLALHVLAANGFEESLRWLALKLPDLCHAVDNFGAQWCFYARRSGMEEDVVKKIRGKMYRRST